jgi:hypothetical protein
MNVETIMELQNQPYSYLGRRGRVAGLRNLIPFSDTRINEHLQGRFRQAPQDLCTLLGIEVTDNTHDKEVISAKGTGNPIRSVRRPTDSRKSLPAGCPQGHRCSAMTSTSRASLHGDGWVGTLCPQI